MQRSNAPLAKGKRDKKIILEVINAFMQVEYKLLLRIL